MSQSRTLYITEPFLFYSFEGGQTPDCFILFIELQTNWTTMNRAWYNVCSIKFFDGLIEQRNRKLIG